MAKSIPIPGSMFQTATLTCAARGRYGTDMPCGQPVAHLTPLGWMCPRHWGWSPLPTEAARESCRSIRQAAATYYEQHRKGEKVGGEQRRDDYDDEDEDEEREFLPGNPGEYGNST